MCGLLNIRALIQAYGINACDIVVGVSTVLLYDRFILGLQYICGPDVCMTYA